MKKRIISADDIPVVKLEGHKSPMQDAIYEFIKKYPHCKRRDIYSLPYKEGDIRRTLILMLKSHKLKETFTIQ